MFVQVMASGMTTSTATVGRSCDTFYLDEAGLRTHPECDMVQDPNFGLLEVQQMVLVVVLYIHCAPPQLIKLNADRRETV